MKHLIVLFSFVTMVHASSFFDNLGSTSVKLLKKEIESGLDINYIDNKSGYSLLMKALREGNYTVSNFLIDSNADLSVIGKDQHTALTLAAAFGQIKESKKIIENGADIHHQASQGTALHYAAKYGFLPIVKYLLAAGSDDDVLSENNETPLILASSWGKDKVVKFLIENSADINKKTKNLGYTSLMIAVKKNYKSTANILLKNKNLDLTVLSFDKKNPLMIAAQYRRINFIKKLLPFFKVNNEDINGNTALIIAAQNNSPKICETLIANNSDIDHQNIKGDSALIIAARYEFEKVAEIIVSSGGKINLKNTEGLSAQDYAIRENNKTLKKLLLV